MQRRQPLQGAQRTLRATAQVGAQPLCLRHERGGASQLGRSGHVHGAAGALIEEDLDAFAGILGTRTQQAVGPETVEHALHVLATAQPVGAVVVTFTRVDVLAQGAYLDDVAAAARRGHAVIAELTSCVEGVHLVDLGAAAPLPALDLVFVGRDPTG